MKQLVYRPTKQGEITMNNQIITDTENAADIFKALGHPSRVFMVEHIARGDCCVCVFVELLNIDKSTVSKHLRILKDAGIITTTKNGKNQICSLTMPCIIPMIECCRKVSTDKNSSLSLYSAPSCATCKA